jgi:hypothetical protein
MHSTPNSEQVDPSVISLAPDDERLVSDEQTVREALARVHERPSNAAPDTASISLDPEVTSFRPNATGGSSGIRTAIRGIFGAFLVGLIGSGAFAWQSSYGHAARQIVAELAPQLIPSSLLAGSKSEPEAQPSSATAQAATADAAQPAADASDANAAQPAAAQQQPAIPAQTASPAAAQAAVQDAATATASSSPPDQSQLLQTMARDLAAARQKIADLETSQQQLARDNAATAAQLKTAQDQVARLLAKSPEPKISEAKPPEPAPSGTKVYAQALRPKPPAAPRRPVANPAYAHPVAAAMPAGMPRPLAPPPQAAAQPLAPAPLPAPIVQPSEDQLQMTSAPRPPMPVPQ